MKAVPIRDNRDGAGKTTPDPENFGAIEAEQKEKGEGWTRNDRLIAVAIHAQTHDGARKLSDLRPHLVKEIK